MISIDSYFLGHHENQPHIIFMQMSANFRDRKLFEIYEKFK